VRDIDAVRPHVQAHATADRDVNTHRDRAGFTCSCFFPCCCLAFLLCGVLWCLAVASRVRRMFSVSVLSRLRGTALPRSTRLGAEVCHRSLWAGDRIGHSSPSPWLGKHSRVPRCRFHVGLARCSSVADRARLGSARPFHELRN
jgi:hypothetical protein